MGPPAQPDMPTFYLLLSQLLNPTEKSVFFCMDGYNDKITALTLIGDFVSAFSTHESDSKRIEAKSCNGV